MVINYAFTNAGVSMDFDNEESVFMFKDKILYIKSNFKNNTVKFVFSCEDGESTITATFEDLDSTEVFYREALTMA